MRREVAGFSMRPSAGMLFRTVTSQLKPLDWVCRQGFDPLPRDGASLTGICLAGCPGLLVAGGPAGLVAFCPHASHDSAGASLGAKKTRDGGVYDLSLIHI